MSFSPIIWLIVRNHSVDTNTVLEGLLSCTLRIYLTENTLRRQFKSLLVIDFREIIAVDCENLMKHINWLSSRDGEFLGAALEKLRKATFSFVMLVCPPVYLSVRLEYLSSHGKDFHEILYLTIFRKSVEEI